MMKRIKMTLIFRENQVKRIGMMMRREDCLPKAKLTATALLLAYQQGSGEEGVAFKKPSGSSGSLKRLKLTGGSLPSVVGTGDDDGEDQAPSRSRGSRRAPPSSSRGKSRVLEGFDSDQVSYV